jgi:hypothetical protein
LGWRQTESFFQAIDVHQYLLVQLDQGGAGMAEAAIVFGPLAEARAFAGRQSAEVGLALVGPGKHGGSMPGPLRGGAVTGGLAAASLQVVDGTFDELTEGEQVIDLTPVIVEQGEEGLTKAASAIR